MYKEMNEPINSQQGNPCFALEPNNFSKKCYMSVCIRGNLEATWLPWLHSELQTSKLSIRHSHTPTKKVTGCFTLFETTGVIWVWSISSYIISTQSTVKSTQMWTIHGLASRYHLYTTSLFYATYWWGNISPSVFQDVIPSMTHVPYNVMFIFSNQNLA